MLPYVGGAEKASDGAELGRRVPVGDARDRAKSRGGPLASVATLDNSAAAGTSPDQPFLQSSSAVITGLGTGSAQLVSLAFSFTASVTTRDLAGGMVQGDEGALRMGMDGALASFSADDYPGPGARSLAGDGISVTASVPEPGGEILLALSLMGLGWSERGRRAAERRSR